MFSVVVLGVCKTKYLGSWHQKGLGHTNYTKTVEKADASLRISMEKEVRIQVVLYCVTCAYLVKPYVRLYSNRTHRYDPGLAWADMPSRVHWTPSCPKNPPS